MRQHWQLILISLAAVSMTGLGIFIAFASSIEEPPRKGELIAICTVGACNLFWLIPWMIVQTRRGDVPMRRIGLLLFVLCWSPFLLRLFHHPHFDTSAWKTSINPNFTTYGQPAHAAGYMVPDIIESGVCLGKSMKQIEQILGPHHFEYQFAWDLTHKESIAYFYSNKLLFDGCDKLLLRFENGLCVSAGYGGCD